MQKQALAQAYWQEAISYEDYIAEGKKLYAQGGISPTQPQGAKAEYLEYTKLNFARMSRIEKQYKPSAALAEKLQSIEKPQRWLLISEVWCGDAAQNVPLLHALAATNPAIELRLIWRDSYPELMDAYLTNGGKAIPKLIAFDAQSAEELFTWGPRPAEAQKMVLAHKENPQEDFASFVERLHAWYASNKGKDFEEEFLELLA